jgi:2',3'-cyclic-nucleotide 2'-phosphodiesterase (5'-nucleotidase family)
MKKAISVLLSLVLLLSLTTPAAFAADEVQGRTVILYTGNIRGDLDVYAQIAQVKKDYEARGAEVILVDAGNYLQGSAAANTDRGLGVYQLMDAAGYDVAAMGLSEFSYGDATVGYKYHGNYTQYFTQAQLQNGAEALEYTQDMKGEVAASRDAKDPAGFKTVATNVESESDFYAFAPSAEVTTETNLKVAFYGLTDPAVAENVQDTCLLTVSDPAASKLDADVVVCLSNAGVSGEEYGDIVIDAKTGGEMIVGAYIIDVETGAITSEDVKLSDSDSDVAALAEQAKAAVGTVVGTSSVVLNGADSVNWNGESNLGDLTADALAWYAENYIDGVDKDLPIVAIQNGGNCDNFIYTGDITETDLLRALPFSPMGVGVLQVTGQQLLETLEAATQQSDCAGFAQVSGLTYTVDTSVAYDAGEAYGKFFQADSLGRVTITSVGGEDFDPEATYNLVCDNYLMNGNDTYYTLKAVKEAEDAAYINNGNGVKTRDVVALYIKEVLGGTIGDDYAAPQGRVTVLAGSVELPFTDVPEGKYYTEAVAWGYASELVKGVTDTTFVPDGDMTRAALWTILARANGAELSSTTPWYASAQSWAVDSETSDGTNPTGSITRQELVTMLYRSAGTPEAKGDLSAFSDAGSVASWAKDAMAWAVGEGLVTGSNGALNPAGTATRAQVVTILYRYLGK